MLAAVAGVSGCITLLDWISLPEGFLIIMERPSPCVDLFDYIHSHSQGRLSEDVRSTYMCICTRMFRF
jgi:hypothetical protein